VARDRSFSKRHGFSSAKDIIFREDAPENLRYFVLHTAINLGWNRPSALRDALCRVLRKVPEAGDRHEASIREEVKELMYGCDWFKVYDIIEVLYAGLARSDDYQGEDNASVFADEINEFFMDEGIGWQIVRGKIVTRGTEAFEAVVAKGTSALEPSERPTAAKHLHEALQALSRRPEPDLPGAAFHAMGSLECVARDVTGDPKATLGDIPKRHPGLLPKPLDKALSQVWGYSSEVARHVREGQEISRDEAELLVGLSATVTTYLSHKPTL
jgi:hypothetical protein